MTEKSDKPSNPKTSKKTSKKTPKKKIPYKITALDQKEAQNYKMGAINLIANAKLLIDQQKLQTASKELRQAANLLNKTAELLDENQFRSEKNTLNDLSGKRWLMHTKSWIIADGHKNEIPKQIRNHPGSFPPTLAKHFIEFFTKKQDWVCDPFMGIGSTARACADLSRNCFGMELNDEYASFARERTKNIGDNLKIIIETGDSREISKIWKDNNLPKMKFLITSPPYFNILSKSRGGVESAHKRRIKEGLDEVYSADSRDIGNVNDYDGYLNEMTKIFKNISEILADKAYLCIIVQNFRPKSGVMIPLAWDLGYRLNEYYNLRQEFIWLQDKKQLGIWGYPSTYVSNVHHHYCLILQKN